MWIQTEKKKLGLCFLWNKQTWFILCLCQFGAGRSWVQALWSHHISGRGGCWVPPGGSEPTAVSFPTIAYQMLDKSIFILLTGTPGGVSFLLVCKEVMVAGLWLLCQTEGGSIQCSVLFSLCHLIYSISVSACSCEASHLRILSKVTLAAQSLLQFKYFTSPSSSLNKEPVLASSVNTTKQLSAHGVNRFLWLAMYANLMSYFFQQKLCFIVLRCWNVFKSCIIFLYSSFQWNVLKFPILK